MQFQKVCEYEGYHSSYAFTIYDIAFVFVDEEDELEFDYESDYCISNDQIES